MSPRASNVLFNLSSIKSRMPPISRRSPSGQLYVSQRPCYPTQFPPALCERACREKSRPSRSGSCHPSLWAIHPWDSPIRWFSTRPEAQYVFHHICSHLTTIDKLHVPVLKGPCFLVSGGLQIDGSEIASVNATEIESACHKIDQEARLVYQLTVISAVLNVNTLKGRPCSCDHLGFCPHRFQPQTGRARRFDTASETTTPQRRVFQGRGSHWPLGTRERYHSQCLASQVCKEDRHRLPESSTCITPKMPCVHLEQRWHLT
jgi:hypothetical protein